MIASAVLQLLLRLIQLYTWVVILYCVFSFLYSFGVLDTRNRFIWNIGSFLARLTEPVLNPVRRILPTIGNVDLSPLVVLLVLQYLAVPTVVTVFRILFFNQGY